MADQAAALRRLAVNLWIPADRFVETVDAHAKVYGGKDGSAASRRLRELRSGRQQFVSLQTADRILTGLDLVHLFHVPREQGGLADIYEDGAQYGRPENHLAFIGARPRYDNEFDRLEARRRSWRESKSRARRAA